LLEFCLLTPLSRTADADVLGSLDKQGGRKIPSMFNFCLVKDGTIFPLFVL
jgi:hypothetical protein